ncbi:MAG: phosphotransferase [Nostocaceae cyanobacterium]|nr:phosphotransferase [Nostocaceae cyanobacterium]
MVFNITTNNVIQYLINSGICSVEEALSAKFNCPIKGNNFNIVINLTENHQLHLKQERQRPHQKPTHEFFHELKFHQLLQQFANLDRFAEFTTPAIHIDEENSILVYPYLSDYLDLASFYQQSRVFPTEIAAALGTALGVLHRDTMNSQLYKNFIAQAPEGRFYYDYENPAQGIGPIEPEMFGSIPIDAIRLFVLCQRYHSLSGAIADLSHNWRPCCLTHNNLQLDNILVKPGESIESEMVKLIDWEEANWGDPAYDLGKLLAGYLGIWLNSLVIDPSLETEECLLLAATPMEILQPSIVSLTQGYLSAFGSILQYQADFLHRVIQFAGIALMEKIQVMIHDDTHFDNRGICMLQFAKSLICRPQHSMMTVFGTTEAEVIIPKKFKNEQILDFRCGI